MKLENLKRANQLQDEMEQLRSDIAVLEHAVSSSFAIRNGSLNTLGNNQSGYSSIIPKEISKTIYKIILFECKDMLNKCRVEFESL